VIVESENGEDCPKKREKIENVTKEEMIETMEK